MWFSRNLKTSSKKIWSNGLGLSRATIFGYTDQRSIWSIWSNGHCLHRAKGLYGLYGATVYMVYIEQRSLSIQSNGHCLYWATVYLVYTEQRSLSIWSNGHIWSLERNGPCLYRVMILIYIKQRYIMYKTLLLPVTGLVVRVEVSGSVPILLPLRRRVVVPVEPAGSAPVVLVLVLRLLSWIHPGGKQSGEGGRWRFIFTTFWFSIFDSWEHLFTHINVFSSAL